MASLASSMRKAGPTRFGNTPLDGAAFFFAISLAGGDFFL